MRYLGIVVPAVVITAAAVPVVVSKRRRRFAALFVLVVGLAALGAINKVSDEFGYVLPWRDPRWLHHGGRNYSDPSGCQDRRTVQHLQSIGWVVGYLAPSRRLYAFANGPGTPTLVWMEGRRRACLIEYSLSGGP